MDSARLEVICKMLRPSPLTADVGCDHGYVSLYAAQNCGGRVIASDISVGSLKRAQQTLRDCPNAITILSNGFDAYPERVTQAVISGMGGRLIIDILSRIDYTPDLVLGAQHNAREVREYLVSRGYMIVEDEFVFDRGKFYQIIRAEQGKSEKLDDLALTYGAFYKRKNAHLLRYLKSEQAKIEGYKKTPHNVKRLSEIKEVLVWQGSTRRHKKYRHGV